MTNVDNKSERASLQQAAHVVADQSEVAAFLSRPETYGPDVSRVERIDTHGAMVFLAGRRAYKIKRAVHFPYMDFSTLARRKAFCAREVEINRRSAPELYLEVRPVVRAGDGSLALGGDGEPVEWMVIMRRFEQDDLFDRMAESGRLTPTLMTALAAEVARFHQQAPVIAEDSAAGDLSKVVEENAAEFAERGDVFAADEAESYCAAARAAHEQVAGLLRERAASGFRRRCHGDLHLRNIYLDRGRPTLFDAIEFNDDFAVIDVLYDLAFLLMDLDHRELRPFANLVLNRYLQETVDLAGLAAMPLFLSQRAAVRAKVSASAELSQAREPDRQRLHAEAATYFRQAQAYLAPTPPRLVAVGGLSGTGKTSLARRLAPAIGRAPGALHLRSDVIRKQCHGVDELAPLPPAAYGRTTSRKVYGRLIELAHVALAAGHSVILDAVYARPAERQAVEGLARELDVAFSGLWLEAPERVLVDRVAARRHDASDATPAVVRRQLAYDVGPVAWHRLDAGAGLDEVAAAASAVLKRGTPAA